MTYVFNITFYSVCKRTNLSMIRYRYKLHTALDLMKSLSKDIRVCSYTVSCINGDIVYEL